MKLVDIHCHLTHDHFKDKLDLIIENAKNVGMKAIVCSGVNHPTNLEALEIAKKYDIVKCSFGLYPIDLLGLGPDEAGVTRQTGKINLDEELKFVKKHKNLIFGVGEVGLDYHWDKEQHDKQKENFSKIIKFVEKLKKPMIVHTRRAEIDVFDMLESSSLKKETIILHCFEGKKKLLKKAADAGYKFSIPAKINKLQHFQLLTEIANLNQLLTETDAPWLSPFPEQKNEPSFVLEGLKKIAEIKKVKIEDAANQIWKNYQKLNY